MSSAQVERTDPLGESTLTLVAAQRAPLRRDRIDDLFSIGAPVTTVVAGAGTGKSEAVLAWSARCPTPVTVVDAAGIEPTVGLWLAVADGLAGAAPGGPELTGALPAGDVVVRLTEHLDSALVDGRVLVIDSLDNLDADGAAAMMLFLRRRPAALRVVLVSRHRLPLALDRLRARGDVIEVGFEDLRYTASESSALVTTLAPDADAGFVDEAVALADGWAAMLGLAATAWRSRREPAAALAMLERLTTEYVVHEVLGPEDPALAELLVDVAVVDAVNASLADAIGERSDGAAMLDRADGRGVFVSRVGMRGWYEIHPPVRRALVAAGESRDPDRVLGCRRRAAAWLGRSGEPVAAIDQWLQVGDAAEAWRLLAAHQVALYDAGLEDTVRNYVARLGERSGATDVAGMIVLAWCQVLSDRAEFLRCVDEASWWADHETEIDERVRRRLQHLRSIAALVTGHVDDAVAEARASLDGHPSWWDDPLLVTTWNDLARAIALGERWDDTSDDVREVTIRTRRTPDRRVVLEATRALGEALAGRPVDALRVAAGIRRSLGDTNLAFSRAELALADALARREIGDAAGVVDELLELVDSDIQPMTYVRAIAAAELVQIHLDEGTTDDAGASLDALERLVADQLPGPLGALLVGRLGTSVALGRGDLSEAQRFADHIVDPFWGPLCRARVCAAAGADAETAERLAGAITRSPKHEVLATMLAAGTTGDRTEAAMLAERAARLASAHGMLQTLASAGHLELIERVAWRLPDAWVDRLRRATATRRTEPSPKATLEPLTGRERDVVRFLPSRLTLKEIAAELYISVNTLKFHLKVIYRKLGVNSRAEAAAVVRSWGRVPPS